MEFEGVVAERLEERLCNRCTSSAIHHNPTWAQVYFAKALPASTVRKGQWHEERNVTSQTRSVSGLSADQDAH
jgi:hypothetical protein